MTVQRACPECMGLMVLDLAHDWFECKRCGTLIRCEPRVPIAEKYNMFTQSQNNLPINARRVAPEEMKNSFLKNNPGVDPSWLDDIHKPRPEPVRGLTRIHTLDELKEFTSRGPYKLHMDDTKLSESRCVRCKNSLVNCKCEPDLGAWR